MGRKMKAWIKSHEEFFIKYKIPLSIGAIVVILLFLMFSTQFLLFLNFALGNDIVVKLSSDTDTLSLQRGQNETIIFKASVITNPFCTAECTTTFTDLSRNVVIDSSEFTLRPSAPFEKKYTIHAEKLGHGLELYQFRMSCSSIRNLLCHTYEEPTVRNILVTSEYDLSERDRQLKEQLTARIRTIVRKIVTLTNQVQTLELITADLNAVVDANVADTGVLRGQVAQHAQALQGLQIIWNAEQYDVLAGKIVSLEKNLPFLERVMAEAESEIDAAATAYNDLIRTMDETRTTLLSLPRILNTTLAESINETVNEFNATLSVFSTRSTLSEKKVAVTNIAAKTSALQTESETTAATEALRTALTSDIARDLLCQLTGVCSNHADISIRAQQTITTKDACVELGATWTMILAKDSYKGNQTQNATAALTSMEQNITNEYLARLPNGTNSDLIKRLLTNRSIHAVNASNSSAIVHALASREKQCIFATTSAPAELNVEEIERQDSEPNNLSVAFTEPPAVCCVFGTCTACCEDCSSKNYPIIFVHGHAFNEDTLADYSLDAFNHIQARLQEDGYIDAGTVSLYTTFESPAGILGKPNAPVSMKASYYFDFFKEPDNYVVVQTKSENIDTYSIRLKELIEITKYKTGKKKVIIVAHSMGGLVSRRYLQIIGTEDVDRLIMIGTPNHGIDGNIADYCPIVGEQLECRDMNVDSLFMNKLNREPLPDIPITNIVGIGCDMQGRKGDGIVLEQSAIIEGTQNHIIEGTCAGIETLHTEMLNVKLYPELYAHLRKALT